jgi:hypothetical protein
MQRRRERERERERQREREVKPVPGFETDSSVVQSVA